MPTRLASYLLCLIGLTGSMAFICLNLSLFAGGDHGVLEEVAIVRINFPKLGQIAFSGVTSKNDDLPSQIGASVLNLTSDALDRFKIPDWYSIHILNRCKGDFTSNAKFHVVECSGLGSKLSTFEMLENGVSDTHWIEKAESAVNIIGKTLLTLALIYGISIILSGMGLVTCLFVAVMPTHSGIKYTAAVLFIASGLFVTTASTVVTVTACISVSKINKIGKLIRMSASVGARFLALTWMAVGATILAAMLSIYLSVKARKESKILTNITDCHGEDQGIELGADML